MFKAILAPFSVSMIAMVAFAMGPWTALAFSIGIVTFCIFAIRFNDKHTHQQYDDRLTNARLDTALEKYLSDLSVSREGWYRPLVSGPTKVDGPYNIASEVK